MRAIFTSLLCYLTLVVAITPEVRTIHKDVVIIGGGASGTYAAIRLREDYGKSIVVVEKEGRLGGHVSPYHDSVTGNDFDLGVQTFLDYGPGRAFFSRLNVTTGPWASPRHPATYADFTTGASVNFTSAAFVPDVINALQTFSDVVRPYESYYLPGYFNFPSPKDIPEDLLLPFGTFVQKHKIEALITTLFQSTGLGMSDLLGSTTLYVLATFGGPMARAFLGKTPNFSTTSERNIELYENAATLLGSDVLYNTTVVQSTRPQRGSVSLLVQNSSTGQKTRIVAQKLLVSVEPTPENLRPFDLEHVEKDVFGKLRYTTEYITLVSHPSLPDGNTIFNIPATAAPSDVLQLPKGKFVSGFEYHGKGSQHVWRNLIVGDESLTAHDARALVQEKFKVLMDNGIIPHSQEPLKILDFAAHGAMHMHYTPELLRKGYMQKMYGLQGKRGTWYTGGAWSSGFQTILWAFDDEVLERMLR